MLEAVGGVFQAGWSDHEAVEAATTWYDDFRLIDTSGDGTLSKKELRKRFRSLEGNSVARARSQEVFLSMGANCDGPVSFREWLDYEVSAEQEAELVERGAALAE